MQHLSNLEFGPPREDEIDALSAMLGTALHFAGGTAQPFIERLGAEQFRVVRLGGRVGAGLGLVPMAQWFGGARVPMTGVSAVGTAPDLRGGGVGSALLRAMLEELRAQGVALSALYPATLPFYQRAGYERAGQRISYELQIALIDVRERDHELELIAFGPDDAAPIRAAYQERARRAAGNLDRPEWMWRDRLEQPGKQAFRYRVARAGATEGYIIYTQASRQEPLTIADLCVLTPAAGRRILALLAGYRSMLDKAAWNGGALDPLAYLLAEPLSAGQRNAASITRVLDWVLRIVDVSAALSSRGYPAGISAELHLELRDDLLLANAGRYVLAVDGGRGEVRPGGAGRLRLDVRDLAALYTGFMSASELCALGTLAAPDADLALASALFSGPRPWIADMF